REQVGKQIDATAHGGRSPAVAPVGRGTASVPVHPGAVAFQPHPRHAKRTGQQGVVTMKRVLIGALALALAAPAIAQQVYKWVDEDGTVHFTDSPPSESVGAEKVVLRGNVQSTIVEVEQRGMSSDEVDMLYTPEQREAACQQARANRTTLINLSVVTMDKDGDEIGRASCRERGERGGVCA